VLIGKRGLVLQSVAHDANDARNELPDVCSVGNAYEQCFALWCLRSHTAPEKGMWLKHSTIVSDLRHYEISKIVAYVLRSFESVLCSERGGW
jgi:hypothetical protein